MKGWQTIPFAGKAIERLVCMFKTNCYVYQIIIRHMSSLNGYCCFTNSNMRMEIRDDSADLRLLSVLKP